MESFASPDYLFYGKSHTVKQLYFKNDCKKPFCLPSILLPEAMDQSGTPLRLMLRTPLLSTKVPFVRFDPADWTVPGNKQRVSNVVFQRSPIIIVGVF